MENNTEEKDTLHYYIVAIGSNIEPQKNIDAVLKILAEEQKILGKSEFQETKPVGFQDQPNFLNGAVYVATSLAAGDFKAYLVGVEKRLGRVKGVIKSGPRTMDLDIITYDGYVVDNDFYTATYIREPVQELIKHLKLTIPVK